MSNEIKFTLYILGLGVSIMAYAHGVFAEKSSIKELSNKIDRIDQRIFEMYKDYEFNRRN